MKSPIFLIFVSDNVLLSIEMFNSKLDLTTCSSVCISLLKKQSSINMELIKSSTGPSSYTVTSLKSRMPSSVTVYSFPSIDEPGATTILPAVKISKALFAIG